MASRGLTEAQRRLLSLAAEMGADQQPRLREQIDGPWYLAMDSHDPGVHRKTAEALLSAGLIERVTRTRWVYVYAITDLGRSALRGSDGRA